jgi:tetratricopeptide (TPR) repeat protein
MACPTEDTLLAIAEGHFGEKSGETYEHIESCESCRTLFNELARSYGRDDDEALREVGRYQLRGVIGTGGMGRVYGAHDPELNRDVAIKLLRADADPAAANLRARLLREAQVMARLSHPNVVAVHDVGLHRNQVFIAMEMVDGRSLRDWVADEKPAWRAIVAAYRQAGQALAATHAVGIVHRDFKPDNALIDKSGRVRVLDFGLARLDTIDTPHVKPGSASDSATGPANTTITSLTRTGTFIGTPAYMAPEQHGGQPAGAAADQFSFCVSLYEALWRERPFVGENLAELAHSVSTGQVQEPKNGTVPRWLYDVLAKGLRPKPDDRYPSMDALLAALDRDPARVRRTWMIAAAMLGLIVLAAGTMIRAQAQSRMCRGAVAKMAGVWDPDRRQAVHKAFAATGKPFAEAVFNTTARILDDYERAWANMYTDSCEATRARGEQSEAVMELRMECLDRRRQVVHALVNVFANADGQVAQRAAQAASSLPGLDECKNADALRQVMPPPATREVHEPVAALRARLAEASARRFAGQYSQAFELAQSVVRDARALGYPPLLAEALSMSGSLESANGHPEAAFATLLDAIVEAEVGRHDLVLAKAMMQLTWHLGEQARFVEAHSYSRLGRAALARAGGDPELALLFDQGEAIVFDEEGRPDQALALFDQVLPGLERLFGPESPRVGSALIDMGVAYDTKGDPDQAMRHYQRAIAIYEKAYGTGHPSVGLAFNNLGVALLQKGDNQAALAAFERALTITESALGPDHPETARTMFSLGDALTRLGQLDRALTIIESARTSLSRSLGKDHPQVVASEAALGSVLFKLGRTEAALDHAEHARAALERVLGAEHERTAEALTLEGRCLVARGDASHSIQRLERAVAILEKHAGELNLLPDAQFALAQSLWAARRELPRARSLLQSARQYQPMRAEVDAWSAQHR